MHAKHWLTSTIDRPSSARRRMAAISATNVRPIIAMEQLKTPVAFTDASLEEGGAWFGNMAKSKVYVRRLLLAKVPTQGRLRHIGNNIKILETLMQIRNDLVAAYIDEKTASATEPVESLGIDKEEAPQIDIVVPKIMEIQAPTVGDISGITMKVYAEKTKTLWVELTTENIVYLMDVVAVQMASAEPPMEDQKGAGKGAGPHGLISGATWVHQRNAYRVAYADGESSHKRFRYISVTEDSDRESIEDRVKKIKAGVESVPSDSHGDVPEHEI